ncbi:MAG: methyl-accepting chemotaxis protein, partial [Clostridia bacterium]|nr:methyl-accepting chemotaxis protein [Clostridia bacterium]
IIRSTTEQTSLAVSNIHKASEFVEHQKDALQITQDAFQKIKHTYDAIVEGFQQTATAMKAIKGKSKEIFEQTQDMAAMAEEFAASTEEISAAGQEQLASTEVIARSSRDLHELAGEVSVEINKFKVA